MSDPIVRIVRRETLLSVLSTVRLETSHVEYLCKKVEAVKALEARVAELEAALSWIDGACDAPERCGGCGRPRGYGAIRNHAQRALSRTPEQSRAEIEDAPPLPDGWEYVGMGDAMEEGEECLLWGSVQAWLGPASCGQSPNLHYARRKQPEREACDKPDPAPALVIPADIAWDLNRPGELIAQLRGKGYKFRWDQDGIVGWRE